MKFIVNHKKSIESVIAEINAIRESFDKERQKYEPIFIDVENGYYEIGDIVFPEGVIIDFNHSNIRCYGNVAMSLHSNRVLNACVVDSEPNTVIFKNVTGNSRISFTLINDGYIGIQGIGETNIIQVFNCDIVGVDTALSINGSTMHCTETSIAYSKTGIELNNNSWFGGSIVSLFNGIDTHIKQCDSESIMICDPILCDESKIKYKSKNKLIIRKPSDI